MKVLQIIDRLNVGGAERVCIDISNLLIKREINIAVLTILEEGELISDLDPSIKTHCLYRKSKFNILTMKKLISIINNYDIIHIHMRHNFRYVKLASMIFKSNSKLILHDHFGSVDINNNVPFLMNNFLKPKFYIGVSNELLIWAREKLKISNVFLLDNTVIKKNFKLNKERKSIVHVSNIDPIKNQLFSIKLIEKTSYNLVIYGKIKDIDYYNNLKNYILSNNLENRVSFIHNENNIQKELSKYKLGLMTSVSESGPLILIEYLAQSLPFLAHRTGQVANLLKNDLPFFMDDLDIDKWLDKIPSVLDYDTRYLTNYYNKFFSPTDYLNKCINIYERIENY